MTTKRLKICALCEPELEWSDPVFFFLQICYLEVQDILPITHNGKNKAKY